jgi:hypothetical protein
MPIAPASPIGGEDGVDVSQTEVPAEETKDRVVVSRNAGEKQ